MLWPVPSPPPAASLGRFLCGTVNDFVAEVGRAYKRATENKQEAELMARKVRGREFGVCAWGQSPRVAGGLVEMCVPWGCTDTWGAQDSTGCPSSQGAQALGVLRQA